MEEAAAGDMSIASGTESITTVWFTTSSPVPFALIHRTHSTYALAVDQLRPYQKMKLYSMRALLFCLCSILASVSVRAQDTLVRSDVYRFADAVVFTYARPIHWQKKDWITFGTIVAGTAALTLLDEPTKKMFGQIEPHFPGAMERLGYHYGKPYSAVAFTAAFYLTGALFNDRWAKDTGLELGATLLTSGLIQTVLKEVIGRARPATGLGPYEFRMPSKGAIAFHSFPSGHSAVAFGISIVMARRIDSTPVKILFYSLAATTAISRMHANEHWLSDIAFGAALAWACNKTVAKRLTTNGRKENRFGRISWTFAPGPAGLTLTGRW